MQRATKQKYFERSLVRCLDELARAKLYMMALNGLDQADSYHSIDFIQLACWALHDQMIGHAIKVLISTEQAGIYFLYGSHGNFVGDLDLVDFDFNDIKKLDKGLRHIRDKTHFHLDKEGVLNPRAIWKKAAIDGNDFEAAIDAGIKFLRALHSEVFGNEYHLPYYDGNDAKLIAEHAYKHRLLSPGSPPNPELDALFRDD